MTCEKEKKLCEISLIINVTILWIFQNRFKHRKHRKMEDVIKQLIYWFMNVINI